MSTYITQSIARYRVSHAVLAWLRRKGVSGWAMSSNSVLRPLVEWLVGTKGVEW
jgi:uncharacterized protein (DUF4415 family)